MKSEIESAFFLCLVFMLTTGIGCTNKENQDCREYNSAAEQLLDKTITAHGGVEKFKQLKTLHYKKDFALLTEDGQIEKAFRQIHSYDYEQQVFSISSIQDGDTIVSTLKDGQYSRTKNGATEEATSARIEKSMNSAFYVLGVPFNLLDTGVELEQEENVIVDGKEYLSLSARYNADQHANHSSSEPWQFYIDKEEYLIRKNWVQSSDHFNIVENLSFEDVHGLLFHKKRKSYRVDSLKNKLFLRAEYLYYDYVASFYPQ